MKRILALVIPLVSCIVIDATGIPESLAPEIPRDHPPVHFATAIIQANRVRVEATGMLQASDDPAHPFYRPVIVQRVAEALAAAHEYSQEGLHMTWHCFTNGTAVCVHSRLIIPGEQFQYSY